ncbi:Two-component hybrid sensor and regulator [Streptomyces formicae]|uniref:Circadian input-output histidine kinase CikA n=1 Tax=Streptomyces formicae TaxID=1616117 RepID=A0A291Q0F3_9ACTN|nr:Two-component hybrid sensor and regulator [Streptomyces formicae]
MRAQREGLIVKIRVATSDAPVGVGFVVGERHIVTCAHVVNAALGRDRTVRDRPADTARVQVEFVLLGDAEGAPLRHCRVAAWDPPPYAGCPGRDVAGLILVGGDTLPVGAGPARLLDARVGLVGDAPVSVFGYAGVPDRKANGAWSTCVLRGAVGGGLIQLDSGAESALRAQPGYSGAPVVATDRWGDAVLGMLAVAGRGGGAQDAYAVPMTEVAAAWPEILGRTVLPPCPYRGLRAFTAADARTGVFVGREREVDRLRDMVKAQPFVMVTGPSGVGKSSLVAAGLQPALSADGWSVVSFRPGVMPYESVARALLDLEHPGGDHSLEQLEHRARAVRENGFWPVASRVAVLTGQRLALIGDQFEEILSVGSDGEKPLEYLQQLLPPPDAVQDPRVRLVCTLRSDFLPELLELPDLGPRLQDRQLNVSPLDEGALTRVIVEPAQLAGVSFTPGLAEQIACEASKAAGSLPLLEFTLTELWPMQHDRRISFDSYHGLGGVSGALNQHAEKVYIWLSEQLGLDEPRIRRALLTMVRARGGASSAVRVTAHRSHLGSDWSIAQLLADPERRLVILGPEGPDTAEIAHEALIREWGRLATWVEADADFQQWLTLMEERAQGKEKDLLSATRVAEAQHWLAERRTDVPSEVADLIEHSSAEVVKQQQTQQQLSQSQALTEQLRARSAELERHQEALRESNRKLEAKTVEIEEARQVLEERNEQLAYSMSYKAEFLANMSHELRTPLQSMLILSKMLSDNAEANLTEQQVQFAETIHGAGSDLLVLINDILDLSRVEAGKMDVSPRPVNLEELLDYVAATFRPLTTEKGLDLSFHLSPDLPPTVPTDEQRLLQVLRNLLSNAVKFTDTGAVELAVALAGSGVPPAIREYLHEAGSLQQLESELLAFSVTDTGIGVPADKMQVIFDAFKQADGTTSRKYGGTGLGLSISREIAHLLGGEIHAESELGRGSAFTLYLPLHHPGAPHPAAAPLPEPPLWSQPVADSPLDPDTSLMFHGECVLVVDDDIRNVFALTSLLEHRGLVVLYAEDGGEAIDVLEQHAEVALVLMDTMMPDMDGYETTAAIRKKPRFAGLPIIALTAKAMRYDREKALESGASDYVAKPVEPEELLTVLRRWLV